MNRFITVSVQERATGKIVFSGARPAGLLIGTDAEVLTRLGFDPAEYTLDGLRRPHSSSGEETVEINEKDSVRIPLNFRRPRSRIELAKDTRCHGLRTALFHPLEGLGDTYDSAVVGAMIRASVQPLVLALYVGRPELIPLARKFCYEGRPVFDHVLTWTPKHGSWQKGAALERPKWDLFLDWRTYVGRAYLNGEELPAELPELYEHSFEEPFSEATNRLVACGRTVYEIASESLGLATIRLSEVTVEVPEDDMISKKIRKRLDGKQFVTLSCGTIETKQWPAERWAEVVAAIREKHKFDVFQVGLAGEPPVNGVESLLGSTTLDELLWVLSRSAVHLSVENGTVRLAKAVGTRSVVLFGPTSLGLHGLEGNASVVSEVCKPCCWTTPEWRTRCPLEIDAACMKAIRPEDVIYAVEGDMSHSSLGADESIVISSFGGFGDNLIALNVLRQLAPTLRSRNPNCRIGFASRNLFPFSEHVSFVDEWVAPTKSPDQLSEWDVTMNLRYAAQIIRKGEKVPIPSLDGMNCGRFICEHLPTTLGEFAFGWDGKYLSDCLADVEPSSKERRELERLLPAGPVVVFANGTDSTFPQRLTKRIPPEVGVGILRELHEAGHVTVQVGTYGVQFLNCVGSTNLIDRTSLRGLTWLLRRAKVLVCCDNGTMHLASQMTLPNLTICTLFGPTDPVFWGYPGNMNLAASESRCPLQPCWFKESWWHLNCVAERKGMLRVSDSGAACMTSHDADSVVEAILQRKQDA